MYTCNDGFIGRDNAVRPQWINNCFKIDFPVNIAKNSILTWFENAMKNNTHRPPDLCVLQQVPRYFDNYYFIFFII